jgi:hypothetical protein
LLGPVDPQWSHIRPPLPDFPPQSLANLAIHSPHIELFDWLAPLLYYRDELPELYSIDIKCSDTDGDDYEVFAFTSYPHPALAALISIDVQRHISYPFNGWKTEWDDYKLQAMDLTAWQVSLEGPMEGKYNSQYPSYISSLTRGRYG